MGNFQPGAPAGSSKIPAHHRALRAIVVPVGDPGVGEHTRRVEFQDLSLAMEFSNAIHVQRALLGVVPPATTTAGLEIERLDLTLFRGPPLHDLLGIDEGLKDTLWCRGDVNFADDSVLIGSDDRGCHQFSS